MVTLVVFANAKILILKLITTQRAMVFIIIPVVFANAKILILKLITTVLLDNGHGVEVVFANAKILILKLITTFFPCSLVRCKLYLPMQRY